MKVIFSFLFAALLTVPLRAEPAADLDRAAASFSEGLEKLEKEYRSELSKAMAQATKVVLLELGEPGPANADAEDPFANTEGKEFIKLPVSEVSVPVLKTQEITDKTARREFLTALQGALTATGGTMAACHEPHHYLRVFAGETLVFDSAICLKCNNFTLKYPSGEAGLEPLSEALMAILKQHIKAKE